jgi:RNA polymerase sigma factor (sigma-70 family)
MSEVNTDGDLLRQFTEQQDENAFEQLVKRHGPMVLGVARSVLRDAHGAHDVAQAAFLVLVRKAWSLRTDRELGPWLHRVTWRLSIDEYRRRVSRRRREEEAEMMASDADPADLSVLHEELGELPERYRAPLVLCYLEDREVGLAAQQLGINEPALRKRLERGRAMLRRRLVRRGISTGVVGSLVAAAGASGSTLAALPAGFASTTAHAAGSMVMGLSSGAVSVPVQNLVHGALRSMMMTQLKTVVAVAAVTLAAAGGAYVVAQQGAPSPANAKPQRSTTIRMVDLVSVQRDGGQLVGRWIGDVPPGEMGVFETDAPPLTWKLARGLGEHGFYLRGTNEAQEDGEGLCDVRFRADGEAVFWLMAIYGSGSDLHIVEYIQAPKNTYPYRAILRFAGKEPIFMDLGEESLQNVPDDENGRRFMAELTKLLGQLSRFSTP